MITSSGLKLNDINKKTKYKNNEVHLNKNKK